ncbi:MAG: orotidine-5'-phosphate decarboxylase [candidate division WOR-3 bacterium]
MSNKPVPELVIALNTSDMRKALGWVDELLPLHDLFKIGLPLFVRHGPDSVKRLKDKGARVFLDLKLCDIPSVVAESAGVAAELGVELLTVHGWGGPDMIAEAQRAVGGRTKLIVVTVLTSVSHAQLSRLGMKSDAAVRELASWAREAGAWGIVCSGLEAREIKREFPGLGTVIPGIRLAGEETGDQARVATPEEIRDVADYIVVGRPITNSPDPKASLGRYLLALGSG